MFIISLFLINIECLSTEESKIVLTDFHNENSPIYVIAPYYEQYQIDLFNPKDALENTKFLNANSTNPQNLSIEISNFINQTKESLNHQFCPIDEWSPLYQPARFYLSQSSIDLIFFLKDSNNIVEVQESQHIELQEIDSKFQTINCYSIFQYGEGFAIDCDVDATPTIIEFKIYYDENTEIIKNFKQSSNYSYYYEDLQQQQMIQQCPYRRTILSSIFHAATPEEEQVLTIKDQYIQYCPSFLAQKETSNSFLIIYGKREIISTRSYELHAFSGNLSTLSGCDIDANTSIESIFSNSMVNGYERTTWNIGFLFQQAPILCKCNVKHQGLNHDYNFACSSTLIELYQPTQIRTVQTLNDQVVLVTGTNAAILVLYLERSYLSQNYITLSYKQIYEPGYFMVDLTLTNQYLAVILTDSPIIYYSSPHFNKPNLYCNPQSKGENKNILKIFYIDTEYNQVYYQNNEVQQYQTFLNTLSQVNFGNFLMLYDFTAQQINVITLFRKQLRVSYSLGLADPRTVNEPIQPIIISFDIEGGYSIYNSTSQEIVYTIKYFTRYIVMCFIKLEDNGVQLVSEIYRYDPQGQPPSVCPISEDIHIFQEIMNSIDLFSGIMGPLLNFNYVPNYNMSRFFPYYQNHKSIISTSYYRERFENMTLNRQVYKVLSALNRNIFVTSNIFGIVEILLTYDDLVRNNSRALIMNQTCIINAREYQKMEKQFPVQIEIEQCSEIETKNFTDYLSQVDYFQSYIFYDIAVQYQGSIVVICEKLIPRVSDKHCKIISEMIRQNDIIQQITISPGPVENDIVSYFFTLFYSNNTNQLIFYDLKISIPNTLTSQLEQYKATNYNNITTIHNIISYRYTYINEITLFVLFDNALLTVYTPGPHNSTKDKKLYYFSSSQTNITKVISECTDNEFMGFEVTNFLQSQFAKQYLIVWCSTSRTAKIPYEPYIFQYIITNINQIDFWRRLPYYDTILTNRTNFFISGLILYVPILKKTLYNDYFQQYYVYNLEDYTPRSLVEEIVVEKGKNETILTYPIDNVIESTITGSSISLTLLITKKKFLIYYLNQKAEFIFHLQQQFISKYNQSPTVLVIAIYQPTKTITLFRNYTLIYNFSSTQIEFAYENKYPYSIEIDPIFLSQAGGFYEYLLLVNQSFFNGPIASYNSYTNDDNLTIIPSPYLQMNKYLGQYMDEINIFGEVNQIIDLGDEIYVGLFNQDIPNNISYSDLVLVLTDQFLLFYQKKSIPPPDSPCYKLNHTEINEKMINASECSIRLLHVLPLKSIQGYLYCQMQLNGINAVIILCQTSFVNRFTSSLEKKKKENTQQLTYIEYVYLQKTNVITAKIIQNQKQFCFCYFSDMQPFLFNNTVYHVIKTGYQEVNTYFGIYYLDIQPDFVLFILNKTFPDQNSSIPFDYANDYALSVIQINQTQFYLYLIFLQNENILVQVIELAPGFPSNQFANPLLFSGEQEFVRFEKANFIQSINHFQPHQVDTLHPQQVIIVGNNNQIYELSFDVFSFQASLTYTFYQYLLCHHNFISRPQVELYYQNDSVFYLVTQCLSNQFQYQSIQVEMTYLLNELNTNIVYTSLFIRNFSRLYSRPVEILEPYLVNPQEFHLQKIQLYEVFDTTRGGSTSRTHLLITNSTYFLIDLLIYAANGYILYYPVSMAEQEENGQSVQLIIQAQNSYSQCNATFQLEWFIENTQVNSKVWFYVILSLICLGILLLIIVLIIGSCKNDREIEYNIPLQKEEEIDSEQGVELQRTSRNQQILFGDVLKDVFKKQNYTELEED